MNKSQQKRFTPEQAIPKIKYFCGYQERSHAEVREKLYSFGLSPKDADAIISLLIDENYLNEQRYAELFAGGRFRLKKWGRVKIRHALKQQQVSEYCIRKALNGIPEDEYQATLEKLAQQKAATLKKEKNMFVRKRKVIDYLLQKGFEREIILDLPEQF